MIDGQILWEIFTKPKTAATKLIEIEDNGLSYLYIGIWGVIFVYFNDFAPPSLVAGRFLWGVMLGLAGGVIGGVAFWIAGRLLGGRGTLQSVRILVCWFFPVALLVAMLESMIATYVVDINESGWYLAELAAFAWSSYTLTTAVSVAHQLSFRRSAWAYMLGGVLFLGLALTASYIIRLLPPII